MNGFTCRKMISVLLSTLMLPVVPAAVSAEEEPTKNFEYYLTLSDYEVYVEFCDTFGRPVTEEALLEETELPYYEALSWYVFPFEDHTYAFNNYGLHCESVIYTDGLYATLGNTPELFGFPESWSKTKLTDVYDEDGNFVETVETTDSLISIDPGLYVLSGHHRYSVSIDFDRIAEFEEGYTENAYRDSIYDCYRVMLTLKNSELMATYGIPDRDIELTVVLPPMPNPNEGEQTTEPLYGDLNKDGAVNASDAACILQYAAAVGAGYTGTLEDYLAEAAV